MHKLDDFDEQDENEVYDEENDDIYQVVMMKW